jgi:hypothetical protein
MPDPSPAIASLLPSDGRPLEKLAKAVNIGQTGLTNLTS